MRLRLLLSLPVRVLMIMPKSFEGANNIVVVTITGTLSGSYNSAEIAKKIYLEEHPDTKIHVIDSLSAGGEVDLIVRKLNPLVAEGLDFDRSLRYHSLSSQD